MSAFAAPPPTGITPAEQLDYLVSSIRLMLWFAWTWAKSHPQEPIQRIIRQRTDIFRRTCFNPEWLDHCGPPPAAWLDMLDQLEKVYLDTRDDHGPERFEDGGIALLQPHCAGRVERDIADQWSATVKAGYQCGSLRHELTPDAENPQRITIHIANACYPGSPFDNPRYLPACLIALATQCSAMYGVREIGTSTWMNSLPKWLALFPQEWQDNLGPPIEDIQWHYGFWGQFLTARRTFNHRLGAQFRKTGCLPYSLRNSWCTIDALLGHLNTHDVGRQNVGSSSFSVGLFRSGSPR